MSVVIKLIYISSTKPYLINLEDKEYNQVDIMRFLVFVLENNFLTTKF